MPIIITIMLSKRHLLPLKGSCRMVTDGSFECSVSHRWNIYLPVKKIVSTEKSFLKLVHLLFKKIGPNYPVEWHWAAWLRSLARPVSAKALLPYPGALRTKPSFAFGLPHVTSNATDISLHQMQAIHRD